MTNFESIVISFVIIPSSLPEGTDNCKETKGKFLFKNQTLLNDRLCSQRTRTMFIGDQPKMAIWFNFLNVNYSSRLEWGWMEWGWINLREKSNRSRRDRSESFIKHWDNNQRELNWNGKITRDKDDDVSMNIVRLIFTYTNIVCLFWILQIK